MATVDVRTSITEDQLRTLNQLFLTSSADAEEMFEQVCCETKRGITASGGSSSAGTRWVYNVNRPCAGFDYRTPGKDEENEQIGELLSYAGLGHAVRRLRKESERFPPSPERAPSSPWVVKAERPSPYGPDVQALSALRLLDGPRRVERELPWVHQLAAQRLVELIAEYPVLMHPSFLFDFWVRDSMSHSEPVPLLHAMLRTPRARLPDNDSVGLKRMRSFATHPCVLAAVRARAPIPHTDVSRGRKPRLWGMSPAKILETMEAPRANVVAPLLQIDRLRRECKKSGLFGAAALRDAIGHRLAAGLKRLVMRGCDHPSMTLLRQEMALCSTARVSERQALEVMPWVLADPAGSSASRSYTPAPDPLVRFSRAVELIQELGVRDTAASASKAVLEGLLPLPGEPCSFGGHLHQASPQTTHEFFGRWRSAGVHLTEIRERVMHWGSSQTAWLQALETFEAEAAMTVTIDAAVVPESTSTSSARRARARL